MASRTAGVAFAIATGIAATVLFALPRAAVTAEECLTEPTGDKSDAQHWYYRFDRGTNRRCWYLKDANGREITAPARATQQPAPWDFAQPAAPKLTPRRTDGPALRSGADAMAELPQSRLRTGVDPRGTPKPQNLAITPTTLTASDASLPRSLDASPWPSAPPQQADTTPMDTAPAAMADDGDAGADAGANAASAGDGQGTAASKATKPEAPIHMLMLVVIGALGISGLLASALYRLSRMGRRRRRNGSWHEDAVQLRRARTKPRSKAAPTGMRAGRGGMAHAPQADSGRGSQPASALDLASARLSASQPEHLESRPHRQGPSPQHPDHRQPVSARRRELDAAMDMQRPQSTDAVWQAADQLADRSAARRAPAAAEQMAAAAAQPAPAAMMAPPAPPTQQQQMVAAQMAAAQAAAVKIAAAKASAAATLAPQASPAHAAPAEPAANSWSAPQSSAAAIPTPAFVTTPPPAPPAQDPAPAAPPAPVDVSEIVSALRKARTSEAASPSAGAAPLDAAKVIAALLVSRAAKRRTTQATTNESGDTPSVAVAAEAPPPPAAEAAMSQSAMSQSQAAQQLMNRLRSRQLAAQPGPATSDQPAAAAEEAETGDPAAALIATLRAHAARQPAYQADDNMEAADAAALPEAPTADDDLDDPAAALINLLQSRFSLPEDELETEPPRDAREEFAVQAPQPVVQIHDDPTAQLMSLLESRSSIPAAPPVIDRPPPQQQPPKRHMPQQPHQQRPPQQRPPFAPTPFEDPATPPLDFIPRPPALRPRPRNIQQDESLDGIQDILARLGRRA
ncbi:MULTISPECIES: hypothetical protein [unclassified Bradyrhizobium]|uniref:hypothetical protein n=1 Tax=unclassified Bradyrhizobium TaxID=2631580 RepID=UPI0028E493C7|nr:MULTISPECIES: hypothetical protein [unclassified Bradyrhizobium]